MGLSLVLRSLLGQVAYRPVVEFSTVQPVFTGYWTVTFTPILRHLKPPLKFPRRCRDAFTVARTKEHQRIESCRRGTEDRVFSTPYSVPRLDTVATTEPLQNHPPGSAKSLVRSIFCTAANGSVPLPTGRYQPPDSQVHRAHRITARPPLNLEFVSDTPNQPQPINCSTAGSSGTRCRFLFLLGDSWLCF